VSGLEVMRSKLEDELAGALAEFANAGNLEEYSNPFINPPGA
jgi:hypothetical protein